MKSIKLNAVIRDSVKRDLLRHRYQERLEEIYRAREKFAADLYTQIYSEAELRQMEALPVGWLEEEDSLRVSFGSEYADVHFSGHTYLRGEAVKFLDRKSSDKKLVRRIQSRHRGTIHFKHTEEITKRYDALSRLEQAFLDEVNSAHTKLNATLLTVTTTGRLKELWPEVAPFLAKFESADPAVAARVHLPVIPVDQLNVLFALPVETAA